MSVTIIQEQTDIKSAGNRSLPRGLSLSKPTEERVVTSAVESSAFVQSISKLDDWFETMRSPAGYGGPVVHWWQDCLHYTGPGLDWRYEGIITGYLQLFKRTGDQLWRKKALRAADDLVQGQLTSGNFRASSFELNPYSGGMPHEAACSLALLKVSECLAEQGDDRGDVYLETAARNLEGYILGKLWDPKRKLLCNTFEDSSFVPNKAATTVEALFLWQKLCGQNTIFENYILPILNSIVAAQVDLPGKLYDGAIEQAMNSKGGTGHYFPYYVARCIPALLCGYQQTNEHHYLQVAQNAMTFILRTRLEDGSFPQVIYRNERSNHFPRWIAGVGDILRAMVLLQDTGMEIAIEPTLTWLLNGQMSSGAIRTGHGFAFRSSQKDARGMPDFRDLLPVCGWSDKALRYLAEFAPAVPQATGTTGTDFQTECVAYGRPAIYLETSTEIAVTQGGKLIYQWHKGAEWAKRL